MNEDDTQRVVEFLANDGLREARLACLDSIAATGRALRRPLGEALEMIAWAVRHHPEPAKAARVALEMVAQG